MFGFIFPVLLQIKSIIAPPLISLYDKIPSFSQTYDSILSIRNPFHKHKTNPHHDTITNVTSSYSDKDLSREELTNIKFALKELLNFKSLDQALINQAITEIEHFNFTTAKKIFNQKSLISTEPKEQAKYLGLTAILTSFTNKQEAVMLYNNALILDPNNLFILNNLGQLYLKSTNYVDAKKIYNKIINLAQEHSKKPAIKSLGYSNLGVINLAETNYTVALQHFNNALNINKKYQLNLGMATQYTNIAVTYEKLKNIEKACVNYRRARIIFYRHYQDDQAEKIIEKLKTIQCI